PLPCVVVLFPSPRGLARMVSVHTVIRSDARWTRLVRDALRQRQDGHAPELRLVGADADRLRRRFLLPDDANVGDAHQARRSDFGPSLSGPASRAARMPRSASAACTCWPYSA